MLNVKIHKYGGCFTMSIGCKSFCLDRRVACASQRDLCRFVRKSIAVLPDISVILSRNVNS